ncbi:FtsX-like permease family protein [Streptomyces griseiscabiei]|uniref:FtsX-like permease family protein n=1 Tax=Streptomyces griseiscabiei TaxID=2993540 RepID=A0ABU4L9W4_9ACTN|nr:FtsX-like permease family protein [Streptomyces griseiscabiei]MBZ3907786.1 FtsX-like permease family protein [Streptomyces griseiscabiei]MDX2912527.1 FtsX-like permease family protein [Streptomyces griseiscabiei]
MSLWSLHTWTRDERSLRRALPTLTVLAALLTTSAGVAAGAAGAVERDILGSGGLTQIELSSFEGDASVRPLTTSALRDAAQTPGVRQVVADYPSALYAEEDGTYDLAGHTLTPGDDLPVVKGRIPAESSGLGRDEVVLPAAAQGTDFAELLGRTVAFGYTEATGAGSGTTEVIRLKVIALYDPAWQSDGPDVAYLSEDTAALLAAARAGQTPETFRAREGAQSAVVLVGHQSQVAAATESLQRDGFSASPVSDRVRNLPGLFGVADLAMRIGVLVLAAGAVALGTVRAADSTRARIGQFAVLRILGSGRPELRRILLGEAVLSGGVAGVVGVFVGTGASVALSGPLSDLLGLPIGRTDALPGPAWAAAALLLPAAGLATGTLFGSREVLRRDPYLTARAHA